MAFLVVLGVVVALLSAAALVVVAGTRMVRSADGPRAGMGDALGMALDVFDPAAGRSRGELDEQKRRVVLTQTPDDDRPMSVDLRQGRVRVRR
ncbi:MAG: hypothetical protein QM638_05640 [Nocardioides sp.]|uniref:hypothetical protein n=1 Tax=Nocardioides sp. TaxID=35761 RepID=UPI0039E6F236